MERYEAGKRMMREKGMMMAMKVKVEEDGTAAGAVSDNEMEDEEISMLDHDDEKKKRVCGRRGGGVAVAGGIAVSPPPCCQAERCSADLSGAKRYHRRHKVCEFHAKAPVVIVAGIHQRFCQQCSRFHELTEFDDTKRSCRRRLAGHNERRRKGSSSEAQGGEGSSSRKGQMKDNQCRLNEERGRAQIGSTNASYKQHFQIR